MSNLFLFTLIDFCAKPVPDSRVRLTGVTSHPPPKGIDKSCALPSGVNVSC